MPSEGFERRTELAEERGFDSFYEERQWREAAREFAENVGRDYGRDQITELSMVMHDYEPGHYDEAGDWVSGGLDREGFMELYMDLEGIDEWDDAYLDDFYDWLQEFYA